MNWMDRSTDAEEAALRRAEIHVRALRDEMIRTADWLDAGPAVRISEVRQRLEPRCEALADLDLPLEIEGVTQQLGALFQRLDSLSATSPEPVPSTSNGLPADARFLRDMAEYLTRLFGLEDEEQGR
jgi:hypothetical protein